MLRVPVNTFQTLAILFKSRRLAFIFLIYIQYLLILLIAAVRFHPSGVQSDAVSQ